MGPGKHRRFSGQGARGMGHGPHGAGRLGHHAPGAHRDECTLGHLRNGDEVEILEIGDEQARVQALRFGMAEGARATCVTRIPAGPIVMRSGRQEIAIGRRLAHHIRVRRVGGKSERKAG